MNPDTPNPPPADDDDLPPPPDHPDCCFSGCAQCVLDDYTEAMRRWRAEVEAIRQRRADERRG
ncbi:oxidoreductase-like domain-containing protein [Solimonas flava]|uniref:oxidoreductase-like domain-containing protein n=1 Tax=Solimonas flava TaxID=415849 RepID=UPI00041FADFF|nr:oxidoreductase-like domain-containing protein [Solimonas flava]